jgi:hypothetical protein
MTNRFTRLMESYEQQQKQKLERFYAKYNQ